MAKNVFITEGIAGAKIEEHNTSPDAHGEIRQSIENLGQSVGEALEVVSDSLVEQSGQIDILGQSVSLINARTIMSTYINLQQLGLTDAQFAGLTKTQAFDLLLTKLTRFKSLYIKLDSSFSNLRAAIGYTGISTLRVDVYNFERYTAKLVGEGVFFTWECSGYPGLSLQWQPIATTEEANLTLLNGWVLNNGALKVFRTGNICTLCLNISGGVADGNTIFFVLPIGFRPAQQTAFKLADNELLGVLDTDGRVRLQAGGVLTITRVFINLSYNV
jgi:hypothetical protein